MLAHKRIREIVFLLLVMCAASAAVVCYPRRPVMRTFRLLVGGEIGSGLALDRGREPGAGQGSRACRSRTGVLVRDAAVSDSGSSRRRCHSIRRRRARDGSRPLGRPGLLERFYRLPSALFRDPLGALVEKEIRFLMRGRRASGWCF